MEKVGATLRGTLCLWWGHDCVVPVDRIENRMSVEVRMSQGEWAPRSVAPTLFDPIRSYVYRLHDANVAMCKSRFAVAEIESPLTNEAFIEAHRTDFV